MSMRPEPIERAMQQFCAAAVEKGDFARGARDRALHQAMAKAVAVLRSSGEAGLAALHSLMCHESPHVRSWACADLLAHGDESARPVLEALSSMPGVVGHAAAMVLREHEAGRLRPPFGHP